MLMIDTVSPINCPGQRQVATDRRAHLSSLHEKASRDIFDLYAWLSAADATMAALAPQECATAIADRRGPNSQFFVPAVILSGMRRFQQPAIERDGRSRTIQPAG